MKTPTIVIGEGIRLKSIVIHIPTLCGEWPERALFSQDSSWIYQAAWLSWPARRKAGDSCLRLVTCTCTCPPRPGWPKPLTVVLLIFIDAKPKLPSSQGSDHPTLHSACGANVASAECKSQKVASADQSWHIRRKMVLCEVLLHARIFWPFFAM